MGNTWLPRLLDIDLSSGKVSTLRYSEEQVRPYIGGSGLAASLLAESTGPDTDPLRVQRSHLLARPWLER